MQTEERIDGSSLFIAVVSVALQAIAWIWPNVDAWVRVSVSILSVVLILFSQRSSYEGFRAWLAALLTYLVANYRLVVASLLSGAVILGFPSIIDADVLARMRLVMTAILAASLGSLVLGRGRQPSVRIVKGLSDKVYLIEDSVKRHILDPLTHDFVMLDTYRQTERISDLELRLYPTGKPLPKISDCEIVKGSGPAQYVIWEGRRKHIPDGPTAEYFFKGKPVREMKDVDLEEIPRTGALRTILASVGFGTSITINGDVAVQQTR